MRNRSSRDKHSFIQFYHDDWKAGTAHMTRLVRSVYFDICMFNWDKRQPMSPAVMRLTLGDLPNYREIVDALVETGVLEATEQGVFSPRAMREGTRAFDAWEAKSRGGRARQGVVEDSSSTPASIAASELEELPTDSDSDSDTDSESEEEEEGGVVIPPEIIASANDRVAVAEAWNAMAVKHDLSQIARMTEKRAAHLKARLEEHGVETMLKAIEMVPQSPFLMGKSETGWKANFDWFLQPSSFQRLIENGYARGRGKGSAWTNE
jgi:hypothetical protein